MSEQTLKTDFSYLVGEKFTDFVGELSETYTVWQLPEEAVVTMDFVPNRLRLFCDEDGVITKEPVLG